MQISGFSSRTTNLLSSDQLLAALQRTQVELDLAQRQISSGKKVEKPSDDPSKVPAILALQRQLEARSQHERNLQHASGLLNTADQALADYSDILVEARGIALSQIGIDSDSGTRTSEAAVIAAQLQGLIEVANRNVGGAYLFAGAFDGNGPAFSEQLGGVMYKGGLNNIGADAGLSAAVPFNINGAEAFNLASGTIFGQADLDPHATNATALTDVAGAQSRGVRKGTIAVSVDGTTANIDLTGAQTLGDVAARINNVLGTTGSLSLSGGGFQLTAAAGHTIDIADLGQGHTAADLGIVISASGATVAGADVNVRLTIQTSIASLGAAIDWTSGLKISQGETTKIVNLSGAKTIQDVAIALAELDMGVELAVNDAGDGINIINRISGTRLAIGENGGTTAGDLGIRTLDRSTKLSAFNEGAGVKLDPAGDDLEFRLHNGTAFTVNLDGKTTVGEVLDTISAAATAAGLTVGSAGDFNIHLAANGNGIVVDDFTAGAGDFQIRNANLSLAAEQLGIQGNAGAGSAIQGDDRAKTRVENIFTFLSDLHSALLANNSSGISVAEGGLEKTIDQLSQTRADVGMRTQRVEQELERSTQMGLTEHTMLSDIQDTDMTEVISRYSQLQTQLQATLQTGAQRLRLSLLDFLQ